MSDDRETSPSVTVLCDVLSHSVRRRLLRSIRGDEATTIEAAAETIAGTDGRRSDDGHPADSIRTEAALHHYHLPKMADAGVLEYDPEVGTIETTDATDDASDLLEVVSRRDE